MAATMIESFFQRSLEDMVKGLRTQMIGEAKYLSKALDEVKKEIKSTDPNTKAVALQKLTYLHMLHGADMSWAAFHVVEVMSMAKFSHKKIGYLAASQSFNEGTDVLLLITNLLRKDFSGKNEYETGLAIEALSRIATPDLARELTPDLFILLASGRPFVRKKATVALLRVFNEYPDAIRVAFKRLVEKMGDTDPAVVSAAVSVLCELTLKDPKPYLPLAPEFYKLLVGSPSNWLSIKLVKIFGALAPLEPRLGRKIAEPLCELMRKTGTKTGARSLLLECIQTVTLGLSEHQVAVRLCVEKLNELMREEDRNLKYLGLRALANLMAVHPWAVAENKDVITKCLSHEDPSIQKGALRLIMGMVSDDNVIETVQVLLQYAHSTDSAFCNELVSVILATCSKDQYDLISDFSWYVSALAGMARVPQCAHGEEIGRQLIDIGFRVKSVTTDVLKAARELVVDPALLGRPSLHGVLSAAAWIVGEYVAFSHNPLELIEGLLQPRTKLLPASVRAVYVQAVFKVFVYSTAKYAYLDVATARMTDGDEHLGVLSKKQSTAQGEVLNDIGFSSRVSLDHTQDHHIDSGGRKSDPEAGQSSRIIVDSAETKDCSRELRPGVNGLLEAMVELIAENVTPLVNSVDVEVQERACNLMGLLQFFRDIPGFPSSEFRGSAQVWEIKEMLDALQAVFAVELGPVSIHAQGRVSVPGDLTVENLDGLGSLHTEEVLEGSSEREGYRQWEEGTLFSPHSKGVEKSQVGESAALLAQHRQRHENFYLLSDEKPVLSSLDYPPPRIASIDSTGFPSISSTEVFPVAEHSLASAKPRRSKARPVVVKLDDEEEQVESFSKLKMRDLKDDFISSAIRDVLAGEPRSGSKYHTPAQDFERKDSVRVRHQRSRTSRTSRHSERETNKDQASPGTRNESGVENAYQSSENEGKPSTSGKKSEHSKSSSKVRHSKHGRKARSSNEDEDDHPLARKSPVKPRVKSKSRRNGRHRATSPSPKVDNALPVPDFLL
ncbi:AP-3 complex subunit delta [Marchantia polymorpha subsp. ruderalis]|uniref:AP-3 complex subunit delta n=4 Tax=Marchantia polymorpha TaxID=3197 RepID=A0AAF6ASU4_MARPO|nr:hypothetical protein MARPO_0001s0514 [Marchantia polymorpha]PTQ50598.1 hypothetical protein MARPO_0001s0514 [Marchantia polymorpha]BBM99513.1 hypothetical protein Mp_1g21790 [Marchantia polymorpha subsp. ruderalis]BBM99514.1 hypothetical protein Mp_1g21790 [Marchantia polymorpha subsp. ruderalis]|eukprot:PTQ50597.1 hypothetical protein MARPO_0001s0514 [Marchantia polymorpha]